ncbi:hypothetical protein B7463_g6853, partial [Scytalidium lignicola]
MVAGRAIRAAGCTYCRVSILRSFITPAPVRRLGIQPISQPCLSLISKSYFSSRATEENKEQVVLAETPSISAEGEKKDSNPPNQETLNSDTSSLPWYLEVSSPQKKSQPLSDRQRIPDLPKLPPPILEPLLQQISVDLGLDDLSLLDLRNLDPPPALGANVLMIIGTTRSEKHLHLSADRLCRWLRTTYKLRPDADGLLGRNELKLKLRRKSRRAKLLGNGSLDDNGDDGIRTGWVCVNVGVVDSGVQPSSEPKEKTFVGFGRQQDGVRIVVQMMTQEKREEMNLEQLWGGIIQRGSVVEPEAENGEAGGSASPIGTIKSNSPISSPPRPTFTSDVGSLHIPHSRALHISSRRLAGVVVQTSIPRTNPPTETRSMPSTSQTLDLKQLENRVAQALSSGDYEYVSKLVFNNNDSTHHVEDRQWQHFLLSQLRLYLQNIPEEKALRELGNGTDNYKSTPFLKYFYSLIPRFPREVEWREIVWLSCHAHKLGHSGYTTPVLIDLLNQLQISGAEVGHDVYLSLVRRLLQSDKQDQTISPYNKDHLVHTIQILQTMYDRGINILTEELLATLQLNLLAQSNRGVATFSDPEETFDLVSLKLTSIPKRLHSILTMVGLVKSDEAHRVRLLCAYAKQQYWEAFWDYWRSFARHCEPRSAVLYETMFRCVAESNNQKACMKVLRTWVPEMEIESPAVLPEGPVLDAIQACVKVANLSGMEESLEESLDTRDMATVSV